MDPITRFQWMLVTMQLMAFCFGALFGISLERRRVVNSLERKLGESDEED